MNKQNESIEFFKSLPRNRVDYNGTVVLFSVTNCIFYRIDFGSGDNLTSEDEENGFDDYLNLDAYKWDGKTSLLDIFDELKEDDFLDDKDGLEEIDGGMLLLKHSDYEDGDIRRYLLDALEDMQYHGNDLILVAFHD